MNEVLEQELVKILDDLIATGFFMYPILSVVVANNGSTFICRSETTPESLEIEVNVIFEKTNDGEFRLPITLIFMDSRGRAAKAIIEKDEPPSVQYWN